MDTVLCEGYYAFGVRAVRRVIDTLGTGVYFYKTFIPTATKVESFMLLKEQ